MMPHGEALSIRSASAQSLFTEVPRRGFSEVRIAPVLVLFKEQQLTGAYLQRA
jgi:hypothetical protein